MRKPVPESRFRKLSLRIKWSNLPFFDEIAAHLFGARMTELKRVSFSKSEFELSPNY